MIARTRKHQDTPAERAARFRKVAARVACKILVMAESSDDDSQEIFSGVFGTAAPRSRKRNAEQQAPASTRHLYGSKAPPPPPAPLDPSAEEALMAAMGLPVNLKPFTAESNGDEYQVWSADPAQIAERVSLQDEKAPASASSSACAAAASGSGSSDKHSGRGNETAAAGAGQQQPSTSDKPDEMASASGQNKRLRGAHEAPQVI